MGKEGRGEVRAFDELQAAIDDAAIEGLLEQEEEEEEEEEEGKEEE